MHKNYQTKQTYKESSDFGNTSAPHNYFSSNTGLLNQSHYNNQSEGEALN
jgi:hypothetical protein